MVVSKRNIEKEAWLLKSAIEGDRSRPHLKPIAWVQLEVCDEWNEGAESEMRRVSYYIELLNLKQ